MSAASKGECSTVHVPCRASETPPEPPHATSTPVSRHRAPFNPPSSTGCVRFAPEDSASPNQLASATAAAAAAGTEPHRLEVRRRGSQALLLLPGCAPARSCCSRTCCLNPGPVLPPPHQQVRLGYLPQGGIYTTDLPLEPATAAIAAGAAADPQPQQPEVRGLSAPNLSVSAEGSPHARLVLRLWADREGPFESAFTLVLPPHGQQVRPAPVGGSWCRGRWPLHAAWALRSMQALRRAPPLRWSIHPLTLTPPCSPAQVEVHVSATVLSRQKGKPALRPHVHCVGQATDTDTEAASDWAGF